MMKVFVDTNVMLDFLLKREGFFGNARAILALGYNRRCDLYISSLSFSNIAYIARKQLKGDALYDCFSELLELVNVSPVTQVELNRAVLLRADDFEDALQYCSAKTIGAEYLVTRNKKDFPFSDIELLEPDEFVGKITGSSMSD